MEDPLLISLSFAKCNKLYHFCSARIYGRRDDEKECFVPFVVVYYVM